MITEDLVLKHKYEKCEIPLGKIANKAWYKLFYNSNGTRLYQICILFYSNYNYGYTSFNGEASFTYPNDKVGWFTFKANTVEEIENFFANLFTCTGALPYDN